MNHKCAKCGQPASSHVWDRLEKLMLCADCARAWWAARFGEVA